MQARPRIDLDGVALHDPNNPGTPAIAIFRYRTTGGLILLIPESADFLISWEHIESLQLDLKSGQIVLEFSAEWAKKENWLRCATVLNGRWTDRYEMNAAALGLGV